jgi:hypothetical protein
MLIPVYAMSQQPAKIESSLKTVDILSHEISTIYKASNHFEAPNQ